MRSQSDAPDELPVYAIRFQERAIRDETAAYVWFADNVSLDVADAWRDGLREAVAGLATLPRRCTLVPERFTREVRHLIYRRRGNSMAYRILFTITSEEENAPDPPTVTIMHIRHAQARPITRAQARQIERLD